MLEYINDKHVQNVHKIIIVLGTKNVLGIVAKPPPQPQRARITLIGTNVILTLNVRKTKNANTVMENENAFKINGQLTLTDTAINI